MPNIGVSELIVILLILILVFGASRLPALGEGMGKAIRSFKRGVAHDEKIEVSTAQSAPEAKRIRDPQPQPQSSHDSNITDAEIVEEKKS